ncbi:hypothetical protein PV08_06540 [Exophiala spinifera]|uniref:C2H2-type domain-containing protein n=1 Tax=Exophiala spinifera TaxID=91928 RepID=A0A0D2BD04_9EURO|nr:uncharacterized protein PV08_06540 [Exophiala spinifera]KIW16485.1 hypothetical protein PV08_06540 [Exophiala spinifera]
MDIDDMDIDDMDIDDMDIDDMDIDDMDIDDLDEEIDVQGLQDPMDVDGPQHPIDVDSHQGQVDVHSPQEHNDPVEEQWGHESHLESQKYVVASEKPCPDCGDLVRCTHPAMRRHIRDRHLIIVDLNHTLVLNELASTPSDDILEDWKCFATDDEKEEINHELHEKAVDGDENTEDDTKTTDVQVNPGEELTDWASKEQAMGLDEMDEMPALAAKPSDLDEETLRNTVMGCLKASKVKDVADIFGDHETKVLESGTYRVTRNLPSDVKLSPDLDNVVFAMFRDNLWECQVPHCGATFPHVVGVDLHLQAHGTIRLTRWYCGDVTCSTGKEMVFDDRAALESHIKTCHMSSPYSSAAGRRVPKMDCLVSSLIGKLKNPRSQQSSQEPAKNVEAEHGHEHGGEPCEVQNHVKHVFYRITTSTGFVELLEHDARRYLLDLGVEECAFSPHDPCPVIEFNGGEAERYEVLTERKPVDQVFYRIKTSKPAQKHARKEAKKEARLKNQDSKKASLNVPVILTNARGQIVRRIQATLHYCASILYATIWDALGDVL